MRLVRWPQTLPRRSWQWLWNLLTHSIWRPGSIPLEEWKYRNLKRVALPFFDTAMMAAGIGAARYGIPAIEQFFPAPIADSFSIVFAVAAGVCFLGVAFPQLWPIETAAKGVLIGMLFAYVTALAILLVGDVGNRAFLAGVATAALVLPVWRMSLIGAERAARHGIELRAVVAKGE